VEARDKTEKATTAEARNKAADVEMAVAAEAPNKAVADAAQAGDPAANQTAYNATAKQQVAAAEMELRADADKIQHLVDGGVRENLNYHGIGQK
jgi:multidrug efflux pump subunit AcrA (membrane-fusion protein)